MTLRFLATAGAGSRTRLAPWVCVTAGALLACAAAAQPPPSGTAEPSSSGAATPVPRILPPDDRARTAGAAMQAHTARLRALALERYPDIANSTDQLLITLMLDTDGNVKGSDLVTSSPAHFNNRAFEFLASQGVPRDQAGRLMWSGGFSNLIFMVYDPTRRMVPDDGDTTWENVRAIVARHFPELYEDPDSYTRDCIWALMDSRGDLLAAGREPEPPRNDRERAQSPAEYCRDRAQILEARYPGIRISSPGRGEHIVDRTGKTLSPRASLVLMVYWLDAESPLP